ncbi:MAG: 4Fe-4S dicluster domain-containing protein [Planctomycetota bacterium]
MVTETTDKAVVAVIDDEESIREGCNQLLSENGYRTTVAEDGLRGLELVEKDKPALVIVDLKMPGMDGIEVLERIRRIDPDIVTIVITGYASIESAVAAMRLGAFDYLPKPFTDEKLLEVVADGSEKYRLKKNVAVVPTVPIKPAAPVKIATKVLDAEQFSIFVEQVMDDYDVIGVKTKEGTEDRFVFDSLQNASELRLDYDVTIGPPKKYLLPPQETLVEFKLDAAVSCKPCEPEFSPIVLIGVHPYDMIAVNQLDRIMSETKPDPNYLARRQALIIIGVDPARASERAFWGAMGCDVVEEGFDLWLTDIGGAYVVEVGSENGARLLNKYAEARDATTEDLRARMEVREGLKDLGAASAVRFSPTELPDILRRSFDRGIWEEKASKCLSCGSCNLVCPTCYCFDVKDEVDISLKTASRYRVWDGCLLEDFAKVAGNENFRKERLERYRHRFYRKGMYLYDKYGYIACVGCGRCASACLPDIADPVDLYNALKIDDPVATNDFLSKTQEKMRKA